MLVILQKSLKPCCFMLKLIQRRKRQQDIRGLLTEWRGLRGQEEQERQEKEEKEEAGRKAKVVGIAGEWMLRGVLLSANARSY